MTYFETKHSHVIYLQNSDLEEQHRGKIPEVLVVKKRQHKGLVDDMLGQGFCQLQGWEEYDKIERAMVPCV